MTSHRARPLVDSSQGRTKFPRRVRRLSVQAGGRERVSQGDAASRFKPRTRPMTSRRATPSVGSSQGLKKFPPRWTLEERDEPHETTPYSRFKPMMRLENSTARGTDPTQELCRELAQAWGAEPEPAV
ncbi:hypothetical protein QJS04_geneDACA004453 [Acorus gramineus]|uniref:Uncharacterized protein n=1 Tax=Acorus gramineus TaxID=55184 RepID=A0AAV9B7B7_ACOGR|nr:hypothetical protein QJS04_geneDACA004453 [Acorus gramineus]